MWDGGSRPSAARTLPSGERSHLATKGMLSNFSLSKHFRFSRKLMQPKSSKTLRVIKNKPTPFHWQLFLKSADFFFCSICNPAVPIPQAYKSNQPDYCVLTQFCLVSLCKTSPFSSFLSSSPFSSLHPPSLSFTPYKQQQHQPLFSQWDQWKVSEGHIQH